MVGALGAVIALLLLGGCVAVFAPPAEDEPGQAQTEARETIDPELVAGRRAADAGQWDRVGAALADLDEDDDRSLRTYARRRAAAAGQRLIDADRPRDARDNLLDARRAFGLRGRSATVLKRARSEVAADRRTAKRRAARRKAARARAVQRAQQRRVARQQRAVQRRAERKAARQAAAAREAAEAEEAEPDTSSGSSSGGSSSSGGGGGGDRNCSDSGSQSEAQEYFDGSDGGDGLDAEDDGEACESLP